MPTPSLLRSMLARATAGPEPLRSGWLRVTLVLLPKAGLRVEFRELVAARVVLPVTLTVPPVATFSLTPTENVVLSLRGPLAEVPSSRLVVAADWLRLRLVVAVKLGSKSALAALSDSFAISVERFCTCRSKFFCIAREMHSSRVRFAAGAVGAFSWAGRRAGLARVRRRAVARARWRDMT